jgi:hypothetical protein
LYILQQPDEFQANQILTCDFCLHLLALIFRKEYPILYFIQINFKQSLRVKVRAGRVAQELACLPSNLGLPKKVTIFKEVSLDYFIAIQNNYFEKLHVNGFQLNI